MNPYSIAEIVGALVSKQKEQEENTLKKTLVFMGLGLGAAYFYIKAEAPATEDSIMPELPENTDREPPVKPDLSRVSSILLSMLDTVSSLLGGERSYKKDDSHPEPSSPVSGKVGEATKSSGALSPAPDINIPSGSGRTGSVKRMPTKGFGAGYESLPDNGSYTQEEADTVVRLKNSKADTSASKTQLHPKIEELIRSTASKYGVEPDLAVKIVIVESGGNPNAVSSTGAIGLFQITGATATSLGVANRFNIVDNIDGGIRLIRTDQKFVGAAPSSPVETYLALQLGGPTAKYLLAQPRSTRISDLKPSVASAIRKNIGGKSATVGEYIDANAAALETKVVENRRKPLYAGPVQANTAPTQVASNTVPAPSPAPAVTTTKESKPPSYSSSKKEATAPTAAATPAQTKTVAISSPAGAKQSAKDSPPQEVWRHPNGSLLGA
jgi:hypothetical protein